MKVNLAYGQGHLAVELPEKRTTIIEPSHKPGLPDERAAVMAALEKPIGARLDEGLITDSMDAVEAVRALEKRFGREIPDEAAARMESVRDVIKYFEDHPRPLRELIRP